MGRQRWFNKNLALLLVLSSLFSPAITFAATGNKPAQQKKTSATKGRFATHNFIFETDVTLDNLIRSVADLERINIIYEDAIAKLVETKKVKFIAKDVTAPEALRLILEANRFGYYPIGKRTIIIFPEALANRQRYEEVAIRTFYLKNAVLEDARNVITQAIGSSKIVPIKELNALVIRDNEENLKLIETMMTRIDKPRGQFVIDVTVYEIGDQSAFQLANQFGALSANDIAQLQSKGAGRLIGSTKLHAFENEPTALNMGKRTPVVSRSKRPAAKNEAEKTSEQQQSSASNKAATVEEDIFQYVDIGLNMELLPTIVDDNINIRISLETSGAINTAPNPEFSQHKVREFVTFQRDETKIVANTFALSASFYVTGNQKGTNPGIIVTLTPHVIRAPEVTPADRAIAGFNGSPNVYGAGISLEEMLLRADQNETPSK